MVGKLSKQTLTSLKSLRRRLARTGPRDADSPSYLTFLAPDIPFCDDKRTSVLV